MAAKPSAKRMTEAEIDRIVELKLNRIPTRRIAEEVGCAPNTVTLHWHQWLNDTHEDRRAELERHRSEMIGRMDSVAAEARRELLRVRGADLPAAEKAKAVARCLSEERQALRALSTIAGFDAPTRLVAAFDTMSEAEAARLLAQLD